MLLTIIKILDMIFSVSGLVYLLRGRAGILGYLYPRSREFISSDLES